MSLDENVQIVLGGQALSTANPLPIKPVVAGAAVAAGNPLPVTGAAIGDVDDAAATDPADDGSLVALLKGVLTELQTLNTNLGAVADAAVSTTATNGTAIALLKGLIVLNQPAG